MERIAARIKYIKKISVGMCGGEEVERLEKIERRVREMLMLQACSFPLIITNLL